MIRKGLEVSYTNLVVAVLEGWLHKVQRRSFGGRWRVRFPHHPPSVKHHESSERQKPIMLTYDLIN
jgi:hypothetical protein